RFEFVSEASRMILIIYANISGIVWWNEQAMRHDSKSTRNGLRTCCPVSLYRLEHAFKCWNRGACDWQWPKSPANLNNIIKKTRRLASPKGAARVDVALIRSPIL